MADPIESFLADYERSPAGIPDERGAACCCGNSACAYLKHNQSVLEGLEKDVSTAARLGKALLVRHETYIADSERERRAMTAHIETLEMEKRLLERKNASAVEENRNLLDQLEAINNAVSESDEHVSSLQATLLSTQQELQKLAHLAARTESLEKQLSDLEREQASWHSSMESKTESERSAVRRWKMAERTLADLEEQIERIEREAREEKERHVEIVGRMERRHAVEKELGSAAGRLKGAAALKQNSGDANGSNVVSHFVKDILQDNANLQMGIVELREMLNTSNEEVEKLRDQLSLHQPRGDDEEEQSSQRDLVRSDLKQEMSRANSQELHVHHHYHAPSGAGASTPKTSRRIKKKRYGVFASGYATPRSTSSTPRSSFSYSSSTPVASILQQTAASVPQNVPVGNRWSTQSNQTYPSLITASGPSSPQSTTNRTSSLFDRVFSDAGQDSSRPTSPDTEDAGSPILAPTHSKRGSAGSLRTFSAPLLQRRVVGPNAGISSLDSVLGVEEFPRLEPPRSGHGAIPEESEADWENTGFPAVDDEPTMISHMSDGSTEPPREPAFYLQTPVLRRTVSHESILSVSAMDIHTLKSRPSQLLTPYGARSMTTEAVISDATAHAARPSGSSRAAINTRHLLSGMAADQRTPARSTLGQKMGGWVFGRWGTAPAPSAPDFSPSGASTSAAAGKAASVSSASVKSGETNPATPKKPNPPRAPGINQTGPIFGFPPEVKAPPRPPLMKSLDEEALKAALEAP